MRYQGLDLNLLNALQVLLKHRSVTLAAEEIHLSQSAMSGALSRLREYFGDDLLIQCGRNMVPTAKAMELAGPLDQALALIRSNITTPAVFDAATSDRRFVIVCTDYVYHTVIAKVIANATLEAPHLNFDFMYPNIETQALFAQGEVDVLVTIEPYQPKENVVLHPLFDDTYAVACWKDNPECQQGVDAETFSRLSHVATKFGSNRAPEYSEVCLREAGISRRIVMNVNSFSDLPVSLVGSTRLAVIHRRYAEYFAKLFPISVHDLPFSLPGIKETAAIHKSKVKDAGVNWLLQRILAHSAEL